MGSKIRTMAICRDSELNEDYISAATTAIATCLQENCIDILEIGCLISTSVYRQDYIVEPAIAALIAGKLFRDLSIMEDPKNNSSNRILFDIQNGISGVIQAIQVTNGLIISGKIDKGIVVTGDYFGTLTKKDFALANGAAALIIGKGDPDLGFAYFKTYCYPEFISDKSMESAFINKAYELVSYESPEYISHAIDCVIISIELFLSEYSVHTGSVTYVVCPDIGGGFSSEIKERLDAMGLGYYHGPETSQYYTASVLFELYHLIQEDKMKTGNILIVTVGSGITVSLAYYKIN